MECLHRHRERHPVTGSVTRLTVGAAAERVQRDDAVHALHEPRAMSTDTSLLVRRLRGLPVVRGAARARRTVVELVRIRREARRARTRPDDFDRALGVQTRVAVGVGDLCRIILRGGHEHEPSPPARFREIVGALDVRFAETVFVDYGSGAGRAVVLASEFPFKAVVGVELSPALHARAQAAVAATRADARRAPISLVCGDVLEFPPPPDPLVIYLYNPFGPRAMPRVVAGIEASLHRWPRPITIVACFCDRDSRPILERSRAFRTVRSERDVLVLRDLVTSPATVTLPAASAEAPAGTTPAPDRWRALRCLGGRRRRRVPPEEAR